MIRFIYACLLFTLLIPIGCQKAPREIEPTLSYAIQDKYLLALPSPFQPLSGEEKAQEWGKEMLIGFAFSHELDLYQAITAFRRALILMPEEKVDRALEAQYEIFLCYYLGKKWKEAIWTFESTPLRHVNEQFAALHDLLLILYDLYLEEDMLSQAEGILKLIHYYFPEEAERLELSGALLQADFPMIEQEAHKPAFSAYLSDFLNTYALNKKSVGKAELYNALLPGAGYLYLGQKQTATTAFLLNGLFIAASTYFFMDGNIPAGIIFTSFEAGWYFGGIYGAGLEAKAYNERLYENLATPMMNKERLFPVLMLNYAF